MDGKINKHELIKELSKRTGYSIKDLSAVYDALFTSISDKMKNGESVYVTNFGTFFGVTTGGNNHYNIQTGNLELTPIVMSPKFKPSLSLKRYMNDTDK